MKKILREEATVHEGVKLVNCQLGLWTEIGEDNDMLNCKIDDYSYSGRGCIFQNVDIGKFSNIAACVRIGATDHPMDRPSLHHFTYRKAMYGLGEDDVDFFDHRASRATRVGHDTWIGHGAMIKPSLTIGHGSVIGQGSVVTKDVPDYAVVAGNPAKVINYRFDQETIDGLLKISWWDWPLETIRERHEDFSLPIKDFIDKYL